MKIVVINPNSTASMTAKIGEAAKGVAAPGTRVEAVNPPGTPASIEGHRDEAVALPPTLDLIAARADADAFVIACFDDFGIGACREVTESPVIPIAEAAMMAASLVAMRFSVVTTLRRAVPIIEDLVEHYGMTRRCVRVRAAEIPVLKLEHEPAAATDAVRAEVMRAIAEDHVDAVILGCAGMADLAGTLSEEAGVPVIDGVVAATKIAEAMAGLGLKTSKAGGLAFPRQK
ncbi:MAG: aspartate/glutamate racemase family protein [Pseudomonadota bacterium]